MKKIAVAGMGYVGTAVACAFADAGYRVIGLDNKNWKIDAINMGKSPIEGDEPGLNELIFRVVHEKRLSASDDFAQCRDASMIIIAVDTPVNETTKIPEYQSLRAVAESVGKNLSRGTVVVVESTIAPTTMDTVVKPILESFSGLIAGTDFYLANCPERVTPGKLLHNLRNYNRVLGGVNKESAEKALLFYKDIVKGTIDLTDCLTAEIVKTAENAYRDVQIAFANEIALICEKLGADAFRVRELVNKCPFRDMHLPGAGVGGHCIPKDSWLLAYGVRGKMDAKMLALAREINDGMPLHVVELAENAFRRAGRDIRGSHVTVLGLAFLPDSDDIRNSPAFPIIAKLSELGCTVTVHDPFVRERHIEEYGFRERKFRLTGSITDALKDADCAVVVTLHSAYRNVGIGKMGKLMRTRIIIDGRNAFERGVCESAGFIYSGVGK